MDASFFTKLVFRVRFIYFLSDIFTILKTVKFLNAKKASKYADWRYNGYLVTTKDLWC